MPWGSSTNGDDVYIYASRTGKEPYGIGPHKIVDVEERMLENRKGVIFLHYPEELYYSIT